MKKTVCLLLAGLMTIGALTGCGSSADDKKDDSAKTEATGDKKSDGFDTSSDITVVSREDGSGTRGAFIELFGVQKEENGEKMDMTTEEAVIANSTAVMMTTVAGDDYAIGYASLGSLDDTTKALKVDGVEPSVDTIKDGAELDENTCYMLKNVNSNLYLEVKDGAAQAGATVQQWGANGAAAHNVWHVKKINWGYYYIYSALGDGESFVLNVNNGDNAAPLTIAANNKQSTQYFKFVDNEDGTYTIVTRASKDLSCVEIAGAQTSGGAVAQQWAWNDNDCQKWVLEPVDYTLPSQTTTVTTTILTTTETTTTTKPATTTAKPATTTAKPATTTAKPAETTVTKPVTTTAPVTSDSTETTTETTYEYPRNCGDVNLDGVVDISDAIFLNKYLAGQITLSAAATLNADCNASGNLDETDTTILMAFVLMKITDLPHISE